ncbi:hypothetical protein XENTR_v10019735 [Xenopus tropicalis]|nr:hypothetical protein XENTR_v10019735 [Xenopus tropicalis]KAE8594661.1 hypothetical protein XENTR_v10019735 [Xenopus tropicalis]
MTGERPKGCRRPEEMLKLGAAITGIGELVLDNKTIKLQRPRPVVLLPERHPTSRGSWRGRRGQMRLVADPQHRVRRRHLRHPLLHPPAPVPPSQGEAPAPEPAERVRGVEGPAESPAGTAQRGGSTKPLRHLPRQREVLRLPRLRPHLFLLPLLPGPAQPQKVPHVSQ